MWNYNGNVWAFADPAFVGDELDPERVAGPWSGHRYFAYDLIANGRPARVVELGTHFGVSFFSFCQAVREHGLDVELHAVDTWAGDEHAGFYDDSVWERFNAVRQQAFADLDVQLHRSLFDDALADFEDGSIDLLHIDGFHSYEAAKHDYETWAPKLAPDAVVLFHDVDPASEYGSAGYWEEISAQHPSITFLHNFGLGVLFPNGSEVHAPLLRERTDLLVRYYAARAGEALGRQQAHDLTAMVDDRDAAVARQSAMIDDRDEAIVAQTAMIDERDAVLREYEARIRALDEAIAAQTAMIDERDEVLREQAARLDGIAPAAAAPAAAVAVPELARRDRIRRRLGIEARRQAAIARAVLPHLPAPLQRSAVAAKRRVSRNRGVRRALGLAPVPPRAEPTEGIGAVFDAEFYRATAGDPGPGPLALRYYLRDGWWRGTDPSPLFSVDWYLAEHPEVAEAAQEPLGHYVSAGWRAGHDPSPWFSTKYYLAEYPEVAAAGVNPLEHYWTTGYAQGYVVSRDHQARLAGGRPQLGDRRVAIEGATILTPDGRREETSLDLLVAPGVDLVTFDLWDTLVARTRPADAAKVATARRMRLRLGARAVRSTWELFEQRVGVEAELARAAASEEYELVDVLEHCLRANGLEPVEAKELAAALAEHEVDDEIASTYPIEASAALYAALVAAPDGPAVRVLSDFYVGGVALARLLRHHGYPVEPGDVTVSCEAHVSKRLGTAFALVREHVTGDAHASHLHVGDHPDADGARAVESGATAVVVRHSASPYPSPGALTRDWYEEFADHLRAELDEITVASERQPGLDLASQRALGAGVRTALLPVALVAGALETAAATGVDRVHYLSREGAFLASIHRLVAPILVGDGAPRPIHLEVSRRSTFGPSLAALSRSELERMWSQYPAQSPYAFFVSLGADPRAFAAEVERCGLAMDAILDPIGRHERFLELLELPAVRDRLLEGCHAQRDLLARYLDDHECGGADAVVADIGWRGTVQDNLCRVLPETTVHGLYVGLFPYLNPQPANARKRGVVFDANRGERFEYVNPPAALESPWTPPLPSVVGYEATAAGRVRAVTEAEAGRADDLIRWFTTGTERAAPIVAQAIDRVGADTEILRAALQRELERYYEDPEPGVADIWFSSAHDDTFGALNDTPFEKLAPQRRMMYGSRAADEQPEAAASLWPAGYAAWMPVQALELIRQMREREEP